MKGTPIEWSAAELEWIEARKEMPRPAMLAAFRDRFGREDVTGPNLIALCKRRGWLTGRTGRFVPGQVAINKGKLMPYHPNSARTRFRKGGLPHNTKHLGHERVSRDGYVEVSVAETNPHTGYERRYVLKHRHLWEKANGPVPDGMALKCLDGDKLNTDPANWEAVPRAMLPRLNGRFGRDYDAAPAELKPTIMAVAKLEHRVRAAREEGRSRRRKEGEA